MRKNNNNSILILGPFPKPITGMALANQVFYNKLLDKDIRVSRINTSLYKFDENVGTFSFKKTLHFLKFNIYFYKIFRTDAIYLTPGHTFFGVAKYSLFFILSRLFNKNLVLHIHSNTLLDEYEKASKRKQRFMHYLLSCATKGIVLSHSLKKNLTPFIPEKNIFTVNNFVEPMFISSQKEIKTKDFNSLRIVFLSNLMTQKGIIYLFEALEKIERDNIYYEARFAGEIDKSIQQKVNTYINNLKGVSYLGVVKGEQKKELLNWGNTFVFPSYLSEGLPISILEAMATGSNIIATRHAALIDLFNDKAIYYIDKKSSKSIENALKLIKAKRNEDIRLDNFHFITQNCTVNLFANSILKIIIDPS